jgi:hypothetical protein
MIKHMRNCFGYSQSVHFIDITHTTAYHNRIRVENIDDISYGFSEKIKKTCPWFLRLRHHVGDTTTKYL